MASSELRNRANWQAISGFHAIEAETKFKDSLQVALDAVYPNQFRIEKPTEFGNIYSTYVLPDDVLKKNRRMGIDRFSQIHYFRKPLSRFSAPTVVSSPCPENKTVSSGKVSISERIF